MKSEDNGAHAKRKLCGERTSNGVSEPCRLRRGKGYGVCEDEVKSEEWRYLHSPLSNLQSHGVE